MVDIASPLRLPCGVVLPNRLAKAAMTEALADDLGRATPELASLYAQWSDGGSGLLVTGNVQVDRRYVERPGNVCIDGAQDDAARARLAAWARAAKGTGAAAVIAQISHAGRQSNGMVNMAPVGPGDVAMTEMPSGFFGAPHAMTAAEVEEVVARFAHAAKVCAECGFDGVQLHAAHGYLLSSFLNPRANNRASLFGEGDPYHAGELTRRARPLMDAVRAVRAACGPAFCISVKLNSADFQEGGLTADEAREVALALQREGVDLLELTGGNYESGIYFDETSANPASLAEKRQSAGKRESTRLREAYFLEYAVGIRAALDAAAPPTLPLLVTGGWRTARAMRAALASGDCDVIGLGRPLCGDPRGAAKLLDGTLSALPRLEESLHAGPTSSSTTTAGGGSAARRSSCCGCCLSSASSRGTTAPSSRSRAPARPPKASARCAPSCRIWRTSLCSRAACEGSRAAAPSTRARSRPTKVAPRRGLAGCWRAPPRSRACSRSGLP